MDTMQRIREAWDGLPLEVKAKAGGFAAVYEHIGEVQPFAFMASDGGGGWSCPVVPERMTITMRTTAEGATSYEVELHNDRGAMLTGRVTAGAAWYDSIVQGFSWSDLDRANWQAAWKVLGFDIPFPVPVS
jgi:hypothetical protein